jgi:CheY-like chemotaxis protein
MRAKRIPFLIADPTTSPREAATWAATLPETCGSVRLIVTGPRATRWALGAVLHQGHWNIDDGRIVLELPLRAWAPLAPHEAPPRRVLVVEDDHASACVMQIALEQIGYSVALAHDAPIAVSLARTFRPDFAIVDIRLPVVDGWELAAMLRMAAGDIPLVAVTGCVDIERSESIEKGFSEHFLKPVGIEQLATCLSSLSSRVPSR